MKEEQKIQTKNTAGFMDSNVKHLYDAMISQGYTGLGDFSNFEGKMKDSGKRRMVYDYLIQDDYFSEIGDFSKFESALGYSPAERKDYVSQSSVNPAPIALRQEVDVPMKDQSEYVNPWTNSPDYNFESLRKKGKIETATPPPPTEYEKDSSFMNTWVGDAIQKLNAGGADLGAGIFGVLDKVSKGLESATGGLIPRGGAFKDISDRFKADAEFSRARSNRYNGKDFTDLWKEGNYMGAIGDIALQGVESLPMSIGAMAATMAGAPAAGLAGIGSIVASQKYDDLDQNNPNMGEFAKVSNAILTGTAESLSEMLGAGVSKAWMSTLFKTLGKEKAQEAIKRGIMGKMQEFYKKFGMFFEPVNEGIEEVSSTLAENITDKITGADPERDLTDGVLQSFVYGMGGGAYFTGAGALAKGAQYVADKIGGKQAQQPITDSNVTDQGVETPPLLTKSRFAEAEEEGRNMTDPGDIRTASKKMEETRLSLSGMVPGLASTIESYVDDGASEAQVMSLLDGVNADARPLAEDFYADYLRISGLQDRIGEEIDNEVETYVANNITPYVTTNPDGQSIVTTATLSEGNEERPVYVRSIEGDKAVISDNGQDRMVSVKRLSDIVEQDAGHMRRTYEDQLLATRQSELDMTMHHNPKTQLPKPGLIIWNGDNAFILQGQDENGDWIAQPAAYDRETGQVTAKNGSSPAMPITENEILDLQDAIYDAQQVNVVSPENDNVASADAEITSAPPVEDAINQPTSEIETEGAIDQIAQPSNVENPSMVMREDGTPDFVSSGTDMTLDFLHDKYGDKMPRKIEVTRKSFDESLKKASDALEKAQEAYDDAPIGKEDKAEAALIKARQEYEAIKVEADFWANLDDDIKEASKKPGDVIAKEISVIGDPMSGEELAAMMLANGAIKLTRDSYKKETGAGNNETAKMFGLFASPEKGGVNIERAGEILELADRENGTNFFDENDTNAGRDAIIEVLSSARTRGDLIDYVKRNREAIAERERQAEYNAYAEWCEENYHMSPEEYEAYEESMARDFSEKQLTDEERGELDSQIVDEIQAIIDEQNEIDAILAQNKPIENENIEGNDESGGDGLREGGGEVLPREQLDQTGGTGEVEGRESAGPDIDRTDGATQEGSSRGLVPFVAPSPKESENPLDYAERIVEAKRLHDEELKVNTNPSEAQKEAGNYKKGHIKINGFDVTIEQPAGSVRSGKDANGKEWSVTMNNTYGYIRGTKGVDGDHIDVFLGPDMNSDMVYVVDQVNTDGSFDEHKVMIGFSSLEDARSAYLSNYEDGWQGLGNITGVALDEFKKWIDSSKRKTKPFSEYKGIKREEEILPRKVKKLSLVDKDDYITSAERKHIKAFLESGLKEARVNNSIYEISNIGDDGVYEIVRRFNYTDPLTLVKDENGKLVNKRGEGEHVIRVKPTFEEIRPDSGIRFREVKDKNGEKSLVGLHNISEEKLLKALRQGGFANPSAAVIDISRQSHTGYGSISLVLPSSMIEKRTGKNAGTWSQDAWTPIYPTIERQFSGKGSDVFSKDLQKLPEEMRSTTKSGMDSYMDGRGEDSLAYMYLYEQGKAPEIARTKPSYPEKTRTEVEDATNGSFSMSGLSDKQLSRLKDAYMEYKGFSTEGYNEAIKLRRAKLEEAIGKMNPRSILYEKRKTDLERIDKYGFDYSAVESFMKSVRDDISNSDKVDAHGTMRDSWNFIEENGMRGDFNKWLDKLNERYGIKEIIFNGFTPSGIRKYIPNTLENVSKFMKKQGRSASVGIGASFQNFAASLLDAKGSLKDIRKDKGKLTTDHADVDAFRDKWSKVFHELGEKLQPDAKGYDDYGLYRLAEAARSKDPQKYIKEEYGIDFSDEDVKTLNEMVDAIRNEYPAMYFETKFERPVYLEEFAAAVVPDNVDGDIRKAIYDAGLKIFTYKADDEISRNEAVKQASEIDGVRFRFIGEKGAANLDRVEEATTRLDNLAIAREMESSGKEAKAIKMATGWERGADKKWRYEVEDFDVDVEGLARKNRLYDNLPWGKEYEALSDKLFDGVELTDEESDRFDELLGMATELSESYKENDVRYLDDYVKDDSLFKEYPELKQVRLEMYDDPASNTGATWFSERNLIRVNESSLERMDIRNILVHEVQHAIQSIEGFAQGGSMEYAQEKLLDYYLQDYTSVQLHELANLRRSAEKLVESGQYKRMPYAVKHVIKESKEQGFYPMWADNFDNRDDAVITVYDTLVGFTSAKLDEASYFDKRKAYLSIAGEVESRNATYRMDMTPEERRNSLASETEDVAREDQIFLDNSLSDNMSLDNIIDRSINDWSTKLNTPVKVIHDVDDINDTDENMLARKRDSKGWYDTSTGEIVIVSPNSTSVGDAQRTFLHEVVGHHGLRELFGDDFDTFLDNVYRNANEDIRKNIIDRTKGNPLNLREATEEYIAELAERGFDNKAERSLWEKIKDSFLDMLRKAGISLDFKLSDNDLRYILWRSYKNLEQGNLMDVAEDIVMRNRLGLNNINLNENGSIERDIEPEKGKQPSETKGTGRELETIEGVNENGNESERDHIDKPRGVENAIDGTENATDRNGKKTDGQVDNDGDQLDGGDTGDRSGSVRDGIGDERTVIGRAGSENKGRGVGESVREKTDDFAFAEKTKKNNDKIRFREAKAEVEDEEPLNKEMVDAWDKVASSDSFKFKEAMVDSLTAIDEFLKLLAKKTKSKILDYENPYYSLIALSSKNKVDMDSFDSKFLNPLNEAIRALIGDASEVSKKGLRRTWDWSKGALRDLVKYVQVKHGIERNRDMSVRDGIETLKAFDVDALSKMGVISESDLKNAKKTAENVAEEKGSEAYKKTYDKVLAKELKKGVDKEKAERSAEIAADYRKSLVKSEIYNKEMDKYKEKVTGTLIDRWEDSKKDILNKDLAWDEEQKELDREALSFQWKLGDNSYGVILGKDYSGLSSVFKPSEDGANKDKWLSDAYDFVRDYESTHNMVLVDNLWDKVHNVSEYTLRRQYESGLISKSYMDKNLSRFKYFIPLRGFSDNIASDVYDYIDATEIKMGNPVKTAKGRISEADNPFAGLIHVGYGSITAGNRNLAKQRFLNLASNHDTGGLITIDNIWVRNVGTEENPEWVESIPQIPDNASGEEVAKAVKDHEEMMRELREEGKAELIKGGRSDIPYKTLYDQRSQHQVQVFVGGNRYVMTVNGNPRLAQAVNGLTNPDVKDDLAYVVARNLKTFMAGAFTSKNVAFSFANLIRDTPYANNSVFVTENFRYFKDFSGNQRRALFGLRSLGRNLYKYRRGEIDISDKEQAIFKEFMDNGGATGYTFVETQKEYAKDLANKLEKLSDGNIGKLSPKELVSTVFECFEFMGNVAELVNRYAAYKTSREHGRSIDRSINDAKEVSVNFNKKGAGKKTKSDKWYINTAAWISEYGRDWVLFFNAAVQSMYKEYSMLRNHPIKGISSRIAPLIFMGSSVSLLNNLFMPMLFAYLGWDSDDDDRDYFDSLSDYERQNNICIRLTHGRWLKIPLSPELANYFKIGDIIAGQLSGKREVEAMDVVKTGIDMVSPLNINWEYDSWKFALNLLPTVVQPIAQNASNVNFMGNPIYKTSMNKTNDYDPEYTKVYRSTSTTMVELSRALNSLTGGDDVKRGTSFNPATWQNILSGYTGGFGTVALGVSDLVLDMLSGENGDMPVSRYPLLSRFLTGGDKDLKLSRMNSIYNKKVVDFISEMDHDYKGYLKKIQDTSVDDFDRAGYMVKLNQLTGSDDYRRSMVLSQYVKAISDMERFLREVGSDNDSLENQVYELKLQALEIFEDSDE